VPALSLQPLVENAIKHGIAARLEGGALSIRLDRADGCVRAVVEDNGAGFSRGWTEGIGLGNLRQRLASLYGGAAMLTVEPGPPSSVTMTVPAAGVR
jgi:LytS/YehU family sensor histidine kinase